MIMLKQGDYGVGRQATLTNDNGPINLTDSTVKFVFNGFEINPIIDDAINGELTVVFESIHTEKIGIFNGGFHITRTGERETIPTNGYIKVQIEKGVS